MTVGGRTARSPGTWDCGQQQGRIGRSHDRCAPRAVHGSVSSPPCGSSRGGQVDGAAHRSRTGSRSSGARTSSAGCGGVHHALGPARGAAGRRQRSPRRPGRPARSAAGGLALHPAGERTGTGEVGQFVVDADPQAHLGRRGLSSAIMARSTSGRTAPRNRRRRERNGSRPAHCARRPGSSTCWRATGRACRPRP